MTFMMRSRMTIATTAALIAASGLAINADVRTDQKTKFQLAGALGKVVSIFGGKGAREGVTSTVALKGNRKLTQTDTTGQIIDLAEEKVYEIDFKKKNYKVVTFADIRREFEEAQRKAQEEQRKAEAKEAKENKPAERDPNAKEVEVDFSVKNTGEKKTINGFDTHQAIATVTVREKGKKLEESGGLVLTSDMWLAPRNPALKEIADFDLKYAQKVYGSTLAGASAQDMAAAMAMYPQMKQAIARMNAEGGKVDGTPILTTVTMEAVKSAEQMAEEAKAGNSSGGGGTPTSVGGLLGGIARRRAQNNNNDAPKDRATVLTTSVEVLKMTTTVGAEEVAIPAGFKENK
jgi:hypothetical protein